MTAISRSLTKLWLVAAGTNPSGLSASVWSTSNTSGYIPAVIRSYTVTGGGTDVESDPVFGGFVDKEKPQEQYQIELEIVPALEGSIFDADVIAAYADTSEYTSKAVGSDRAFFIQANSGSTYKSWGFNNCSITSFEQEHSADDNATQTLTLKFAPTTETGAPNKQYAKVTVTSLRNWSALTV